MRRIFSTLMSVVALMFATEASAQVDFGGTVFNNDILGWGDMYNLSFTSHNYGTARSMAMGNAFTALGADMVSASLNPAGIGMYTSGDVNLTPMLQYSESKMKGSEPYYLGASRGDQDFTDDTLRFGFSNFGFVFPVFRSAEAVTNINVGFVYNRIADFSQNYMGATRNQPYTNTMANVFCTLSNIDGLQTNDDGTMNFGNDPYYWGSVLAYKNGLTNKDDQDWFVDRIGEGASIDQYTAVETRGSVGEYAMTMGMNFIDKLYFGLSLGLQTLDYRREMFYGENYNYTERPSGDVMPYQLDYMNYMQSTEYSGTGVNVKVGVTARPVDWLRVGVAYHSPTFYSVDLFYKAEMWSSTLSAGNNPDGYDVGPKGYMYDRASTGVWEDSGPYSWEFRTPSRLLVGSAVTIARRVIVSADYERSWYQTLHLMSSPIESLNYGATMDKVFKGSDTVRVGAEGFVLPYLALRAGYIWSGNTLRDEFKDAVFTHPLTTSTSSITAGVGLKFSEDFYLDLAYQYNVVNYSAFKTFYATDASNDAQSIESKSYGLSTDRHIALLTLGFRF
jgi:hypothetical protein